MDTIFKNHAQKANVIMIMTIISTKFINIVSYKIIILSIKIV